MRQAELIPALGQVGEFFAAGFMEGNGVPTLLRVAHGIRNHLSRCPLPPYQGQMFYPQGTSYWDTGSVVWHHYVKLQYDAGRLAQRHGEAGTDTQRAALEELQGFWEGYPDAGGYTHSIPHYERVLEEGLNGFEERIRGGMARRGAPLHEALLVVVDAVRVLHGRMVEQVKAGDCDTPQSEARRRTLLEALDVAPFQPARSFWEAMVATHFVFTLDGPDNLGRFDQFLHPYYTADRERGALRREEALEMVKALWAHLDEAGGYNVALGGTTPEGSDASNELTILALEAARGRRRPNLALRLRRDTPEEVWDAALETIATGNGLPALYGEENYLHALRDADLNLSEQDLLHFAFGGCTETMIHGRSNVGSLDADFNMPRHLVTALHEDLEGCTTVDEFLARYRERLRSEIQALTEVVNAWQRTKAEHHPQLIRTLLVDDCIDRDVEYAAGGARYNWSVINVQGLANVIDSLCAVREVVFERREVTIGALLQALKDDFQGHEGLRRRLQQSPRYGNDEPAADELARHLSAYVFREFMCRKPWRGGRFVPACLMFVTYAQAGERVAATPDGRRAGEPIADSAGAHQGRDASGPTALLRSACCLDQVHAPGTLVVNIRLSLRLFGSAEEREKIKGLVRAYFRMGGMQIQIGVVDQAVLRDALEHPERHENLIIRVGGYSEYWSRLSHALQLSILERTEHG